MTAASADPGFPLSLEFFPPKTPEGVAKLAAARAEIDSLSHRAKEELRKQVGQLAVAGAEKILKREIDANAHKALLDQLASEI